MAIEQKSVKNAAISVFVGGVTSKAVGFLGSIVLARILVPEDYGYWVIVTMITSFFSLVIDAGFEYYYIVKVNINKGEETPREYVTKIENSIFFLRVVVNLVLFVLQFGLSFLPIDLLSSPIDKIIRLLSFVHLINVMGRINEVRLKKHFNFNKITKFNIISVVVSTIVQVGCAILGFGVMSFAWGSIVKTLINNVGLVSIGRFKPQRKYISRPILKEIFSFAMHSWIGNAGQYILGQIDKFLLKRNFSMAAIGYYSFGNGTANMFWDYIVSPQGSVIMNFISNHQGQPRKLEELVAFVNNFLFIVVLPMQIFLYVFAEQFIIFLYGIKWIEAVPVFRMFIIFTCVETVFSPYGYFLVAFGRVNYRAKLNWFSVVLYGCVLGASTLFSPTIVEYATVYVICTLSISAIKSYISVRVSKVSLRSIFQKIKNTIMISLSMVALLFLPSSVAIIPRLFVFFTLSSIFVVLIFKYDKNVLVEIDKRLLGSKIKNTYYIIKLKK